MNDKKIEDKDLNSFETFAQKLMTSKIESQIPLNMQTFSSLLNSNMFDICEKWSKQGNGSNLLPPEYSRFLSNEKQNKRSRRVVVQGLANKIYKHMNFEATI